MLDTHSKVLLIKNMSNTFSEEINTTTTYLSDIPIDTSASSVFDGLPSTYRITLNLDLNEDHLDSFTSIDFIFDSIIIVFPNLRVALVKFWSINVFLFHCIQF